MITVNMYIRYLSNIKERPYFTGRSVYDLILVMNFFNEAKNIV
jgi:hypothetical protein